MEFKFPDVGEGITEGTIVKWKVKNGDTVKADQPIVEIETDKAVVDIPCPKAGVITKITHKEGETINVGEVLVVIADKGKKAKKERYTGSVIGFLEEAKEEVKTKKIKGKKAKERVSATFRVRRLAKALKVDLLKVKGTGRDGRITEKDVRKSTKKTVEPDFPDKIERIPFKGVRKTISEHLLEAQAEAVLVTNFHDADVTKLWDLRKKDKKKAEKKGIKITFLPYIINAVVDALKKHPLVNASVEGDEIVLKKYYNIGIAVDTDGGLIVPVLKNADKKDLLKIASELQELAGKARKKRLALTELRNGTFSITNLGSIGVKFFTPVVNYPDSAILGTGRIEEQARVVKGKIVIKKIMPLSFTYDHRIIDGATASRFMIDVIAKLEDFS